VIDYVNTKYMMCMDVCMDWCIDLCMDLCVWIYVCGCVDVCVDVWMDVGSCIWFQNSTHLGGEARIVLQVVQQHALPRGVTVATVCI
jgi:hypothetical protein